MTEHSGSPHIIPRHLGLIMDGNGRWAQRKGLPRSAGHQAGVETIRQIVNDCAEIGIQILTLYTFSTENWSRPPNEVNFIMMLIEKYAINEMMEMKNNGIRIQLMGERQGLPATLLAAMDSAMETTQDNSRLILNLAINYGGRAEIIHTVKSILANKERDPSKEVIVTEELIQQHLFCQNIPDVDLIIRTGGENRLSNFLTWRAADTIFWSTPVFWPDFNRVELFKGIEVYAANEA